MHQYQGLRFLQLQGVLLSKMKPSMNQTRGPQIHVLEASAGSGKTYALAKHYLKLIINPGVKPGETPVKNILAITFTNKASVEMKTRIFEFLKKIALDTFSAPGEKADILGSLGVPEEEARKAAFSLLDRIIGDYGSFRVQTVDSFINEIISGSSFRLNLSSRFDIKTDYKDYLSRSLDLLIENSGADDKVREALSEFISRYLHIEKKTGWLPRQNILAVVSDLYGKANTFGGNFKKAVEYSSGDIFALKGAAFDRMKRLFEQLPEKTNKAFKDKLGRLITGPGGNFSIGALGRFFEREELPLNKGCPPCEKADRLWSELRQDLTDISNAEALSFYNCYIDIYGAVIKYFERLSRKDDLMFLGELNRRANDVFTEGGDVVPELYYRMSARFRHFLIDEFQDTSVIQWKNVKPMIEELLSNGGSLFYVGDKKQAIYRFRGGDAGLFDRVPKNFPLIGSNLEILDKNYRSREELVKFNNGLFSKENIGRFIADYCSCDEEKSFSPADTEEILKIYGDSAQKPGRDNPGGSVSVKFIEARNNDERDALMKKDFAALVRSVSERYPFKDIAVLARQNDDIELFTGWLLSEGIPAESEKTLNLKGNPAVKELVSFLMFLDSPIDNVAFASFLLGDIFARAGGLERAALESFLFQAGRDPGGRSYLYKAFREKYPGIWDAYFEEFFVSVGFMPVYELVVSVLSRFKVTSNFGQFQGFIAHLLELIKEQEKENSSLKDFLEYFQAAPEKDLYVRFSGVDSVRLMTIHKAKGLEFPVVIIPYLTMDISALEGKGPAGSYFLEQAENGLTLVKLNREYAAFSEKLAVLYRDNLKKSLIDELNAVYVALTRAKDELHVFIPAKSGNKKNAARLFVGGELEAGSKTSGEKDEPLKLNTLPADVYGDWIKILKNEFSGGFEPGKKDAALAGEALHYGLSLLGNLKGLDAGKTISGAISKMKTRYPMIEHPEALAAVVSGAACSEALKEIFFVDNGRVLNEQEIIGGDGSTKRLDRLIEAGDRVVVADYKSSRENMEAHVTQIKGYIELLKGVYPGRHVEGRLVYLDTLTVEKVF